MQLQCFLSGLTASINFILATAAVLSEKVQINPLIGPVGQWHIEFANVSLG